MLIKLVTKFDSGVYNILNAKKCNPSFELCNRKPKCLY